MKLEIDSGRPCPCPELNHTYVLRWWNIRYVMLVVDKIKETNVF